MVSIKITKKLLDNYRDYKIDLAMSDIKENFNYTVIEYMIQNGWTLIKFKESLGDLLSITINVETGEILNKETHGMSDKDLKIFMEMMKSKSTYTEYEGYKYEGSFGNPYDIKF